MKALTEEAMRSGDALILKILRVLGQHQDAKHQAKFAPSLMGLVRLSQVLMQLTIMACASLIHSSLVLTVFDRVDSEDGSADHHHQAEAALRLSPYCSMLAG